MKITIAKNQVTFLLASGSKCSMATTEMANMIINNCKEAKRVFEKRRNTNNFSNEPVKILGTLIAPVESNSWRTKNAHFVILENGLEPLIGKNLFETIGIFIKQNKT